MGIYFSANSSIGLREFSVHVHIEWICDLKGKETSYHQGDENPTRLEESETPSNAGTNDGYGELDVSPLMDKGRELPVWMNSCRKLWAVLSLALSGW